MFIPIQKIVNYDDSNVCGAPPWLDDNLTTPGTCERDPVPCVAVEEFSGTTDGRFAAGAPCETVDRTARVPVRGCSALDRPLTHTHGSVIGTAFEAVRRAAYGAVRVDPRVTARGFASVSIRGAVYAAVRGDARIAVHGAACAAVPRTRMSGHSGSSAHGCSWCHIREHLRSPAQMYRRSGTPDRRWDRTRCCWRS